MFIPVRVPFKSMRFTYSLKFMQVKTNDTVTK